MRRFLLLTAVTVLAALTARSADEVYRNVGILDCDEVAPQIDALTFINDGFFCANLTAGSLFPPNSALPFGTSNTRWFTNNGTMQAFPGFELDFVGDDGIHRMASGIVNGNGATLFGTQFMLLSASNLVSRGLLEVGGSGLIQLRGGNVNLSRGGILIDAPGGTGGGACAPAAFYQQIIDATNYVGETGIDDIYWGAGGLTNLVLDQLVRQVGPLLTVQSPRHAVTNLARPNGFGVSVGPIVNPATFVLTNTFVNGTNTNWIVQAVFVGNLSPDISAQVRFVDSTYPSGNPGNNGFRSAVVELISAAPNVVTGGNILYTLYLTDQLATDTNLVSLTNVFFLGGPVVGTQRPAPYIVNTFPPCEFFLSPIFTNSSLTPGLIYTNAYTNRVVAASYAGYEAAAFLNQVSGPSALPTNLPGRVEITADRLDMSHTRIRGESQVSVKATHLIASSNAVVDSPNLSYDLGSTNGPLKVSGNDLTRPSVQRFGGTIAAWSGVWTNFLNEVVPDPADPTTNITITTEINFHALILDGRGLMTTAPVFLNDLTSRGKDAEFNDSLQISRSLLIQNENLTINGTLDLAPGIDWNSVTVPALKNLTNFGSINIFEDGEFGNSSRPYLSMLNTGTVSAFSVAADVESFENRGQINATGPLQLRTRIGKLEGGRMAAGGILSVRGGDFKLRGAELAAPSLDLLITNSLIDDGVTALNTLDFPNGVNLLSKPRFGDLFGTTLRTVVPQFGGADYTWAGEDRGPTAAGFSNNVVIGHLVLGGGSANFISLAGASSSNALYVDLLELQGAVATNLESTLTVADNLVVYFADSNVPVEELDGRLGGRFKWVSSFAGPNSSVDVLLLNGQTIQVNRALRDSLTIDSDGDGVANGLDFFPFDAEVWTTATLATAGGNKAPMISWNAQPSSTYVLEYTTSLGQPDWRPLKTINNDALTPAMLSIVDTNALVSGTQRFYRIRYQAR